MSPLPDPDDRGAIWPPCTCGPDSAPVTAPVVESVRVGFCTAEVKPFGPAQAYVAPVTVGVESEIVAPSQYGPPFDAVGVAGAGLTTTSVVPAAEVQPPMVIVTIVVAELNAPTCLLSTSSVVAPPQATEVIVTKRRVGAFSTTDLESVLRARQVTCLVLLGIATSGVVLSTVRWAADADYALVVLEDCCADGDEEVQRVLMH